MVIVNANKSQILVEVFCDQTHVSDPNTGKETDIVGEVQVDVVLRMKEQGKTDIGIHIHSIEVYISSGKYNLSCVGMINPLCICLKGYNHKNYC